MKALLHFDASPALQQRFRDAAPAWLEFAFAGSTEPALAARLNDADVLLHVLTPVTAEMLAQAPRLRLIQKIGVGVNTIDLAAAADRGIAVANMPGTNTQAVAECTLALMLAVLRKLLPFDAATRRGEGWTMPPESSDDVGELAGRCIGLVGYGAVPRRLAPVLQALGARVLFHARREITDGIGTQLPLPALLQASDVVSLHVPLTTETRHLIDAAALGTMRPGAILVNTARGALVDEAALHAALVSGRLRGTGLDVLDREPAAAGHPLFALPNVVVTPHLAWLTSETMARSIGVVVENCTRLRDGQPLLHHVAPP